MPLVSYLISMAILCVSGPWSQVGDSGLSVSEAKTAGGLCRRG